ncbi:MAG: bifunctional diaminohydroxyphosphoribosylaminopyrimidine deaminase/5-amino-6-(5-phosphoribosylamino)uracil reductase RibD [Tannerella sp.]|nr:bifunctional diaminohydroxyphosphoribosylaminopyrimidine deaminase/5-amino-6-(5-phosphoribosylamino)uracil reductase RibD [Tannerella sp.]
MNKFGNMDICEKFMARCLDIAAGGIGFTAPNPMVGAVIVGSDGAIIGEGFHRCFGEAHAEVNAIRSVKDEKMLKNSTMYVNLEPCSHYGKTPPCVELIIAKAIPRVVIACRDPFPEVAGRGIKMLHDAGIDVVMGVMEDEARTLNRYFITAHEKRRPYVILKWAQSEDGFIDNVRIDDKMPPVMLSTPLTRMMVHRLRSEVQAIMVGTNTAILDNPSLTVRHWPGKSPLRVIIDRNRRIPQDHKIFTDKNDTLVFGDKSDDPDKIMSELYKRDIHSLLVEGGSQLHRSFIEKSLWDEIIVETAPIRLKEGVKAADFRSESNVQLFDKQTFIYHTQEDVRMSIIEKFHNCDNQKNIV